MAGAEEKVDVVVLGAGAAGLMAAMEAGRRARRVLLVDHADRAGKKILISGGGRCNFTHLHCRAENFLSNNPHFAKSALARFTPADMVAMVERHGIAYHEKTAGQLFCDRSSQEIVTMLERECADAGVRIWTGVNVTEVTRTNGGASNRFRVCGAGGMQLTSESLVVATGGLSIPKMGATGFGYELAERFEHRVVPCRPGLVPLTFTPEDRERWCDLAGLSADVVVSSAPARPGIRTAPPFWEKMLLTHRGLSGPAVLQVSSYWQAGEALAVDLAPGATVFSSLTERNARRDATSMSQALRSFLPARLADRWSALYPPRDWTNASLELLEQSLHAWTLHPAGNEGYAKAEVTVGGVDTDLLDARTMESRLVPGLFFVGEVVDVTGWLGGYNFQWAWASGHAAGLVA